MRILIIFLGLFCFSCLGEKKDKDELLKYSPLGKYDLTFIEVYEKNEFYRPPYVFTLTREELTIWNLDENDTIIYKVFGNAFINPINKPSILLKRNNRWGELTEKKGMLYELKIDEVDIENSVIMLIDGFVIKKLNSINNTFRIKR